MTMLLTKKTPPRPTKAQEGGGGKDGDKKKKQPSHVPPRTSWPMLLCSMFGMCAATVNIWHSLDMTAKVSHRTRQATWATAHKHLLTPENQQALDTVAELLYQAQQQQQQETGEDAGDAVDNEKQQEEEPQQPQRGKKDDNDRRSSDRLTKDGRRRNDNDARAQERNQKQDRHRQTDRQDDDGHPVQRVQRPSRDAEEEELPLRGKKFQEEDVPRQGKKKHRQEEEPVLYGKKHRHEPAEDEEERAQEAEEQEETEEEESEEEQEHVEEQQSAEEEQEEGEEEEETSSNDDEEDDPLVTFIEPSDLSYLDSFAATWWQSTERFVDMLDPSKIHSVEGGVFNFIRKEVYRHSKQKHDLRMTVDWLQLAVEHTSKAWKLAGYAAHPTETPSYHMFVDKLLNYTQLQDWSSMRQQTADNPMADTLALIAFMPYRSSVNATRGRVMTAANLVATLTSLIRVQCGRVVLAVEGRDWRDSLAILQASKELLLQQQKRGRQPGTDNEPMEPLRPGLEVYFQKYKKQAAKAQKRKHEKGGNKRPLPSEETVKEFTIGRTEIGLVKVPCAEKHDTKRGKMRMLPKAALMGLQKALILAQPDLYRGTDNRTVDPAVAWVKDAAPWLGTKRRHHPWKYTYLTEPDTVLHVKRHALPSLQRELQWHRILMPHRLQPIPHGSDLPAQAMGIRRVLPATGRFSKVFSIHPHGQLDNEAVDEPDDKCCDAGSFRPGRQDDDTCGTFWWTCGFTKYATGNTEQDHFRLAGYQLIRLEAPYGTGIVSLAGGAHGRRCTPQRGATCRYAPSVLGSAEDDDEEEEEEGSEEEDEEEDE